MRLGRIIKKYRFLSAAIFLIIVALSVILSWDKCLSCTEMRRIFLEPTFLTKQRLSKEESQASMAYIQELENCRRDKSLERG